MSPSSTRMAPAIRGTPCACIFADDRPGDGCEDGADDHGLDDRRREPEQPDQAEEDEPDADEEPREQPQVAQPHRRREDPRQRGCVDLHHCLVRRRAPLPRTSALPATEAIEKPSHLHRAHSVVVRRTRAHALALESTPTAPRREPVGVVQRAYARSWHAQTDTHLPLSAALLVSLALLAAGCGGDDDSSSEATSASPPEEWADGFCSAMTTWTDDLQAAAEPLGDLSSLSEDGIQQAADDAKVRDGDARREPARAWAPGHRLGGRGPEPRSTS